MKKKLLWLPTVAAGAALCTGGAAFADETISHVLGADNLETLYATVMPDGTIKLSHEPPQAAAPKSDAPVADTAKAEECGEKAAAEHYPEK